MRNQDDEKRKRPQNPKCGTRMMKKRKRPQNPKCGTRMKKKGRDHRTRNAESG